MNNKYYLMLEAKSTRDKRIVGYPIYFDYDLVNCNRDGWKSDCIVQCQQEEIELRVKNPKILFDFENTALDNFFFSNILWEVICDYCSWDMKFKKVKLYGKDKKKISTKEYIVACFENRYDDNSKYIDKLESEYILPNFKHKKRAELINPAIDYEKLSQFDILPSNLSANLNALIVSERVMKDTRLKDTKLTFLPLENAPKILMFQGERMKINYKVKDIESLKNMVPIKGKDLLNGFKGKKIIF